MTGAPVEIRAADDDNASLLRATRHGIGRRDATVLIAWQNDRPQAAAMLEPAGRPTDPVTPAAIFELLQKDAQVEWHIAPLLEAIVNEARSRGMERLMTGWDPMDHRGLRVFEQRGFRPTGAMPYFDLGGGEVQYVSGYQDATGSTLDLALQL